MKVALRSHPRSGTNMLRAMLNIALTGADTIAPATTGHWAQRVQVMAPTGYRPRHNFYAGEKDVVYVYRDGRDVMASLWRTKGFLHPDWAGLSFSEFLCRPLDWRGSPGKCNTKGIEMTAVEHWRAHLDSWRDRPGVLYVRYEHLLLNPQAQIERIAERFGLDVVAQIGEVGPAGPFPSGDHRLHKWRDVFSDDDLKYFFEVVPRDHWGLWECF